MSAHAGILRLSTDGDGEVVDITAGVRSVIHRSAVETGIAIVFAVGATVAVTTMEHEPGGVADLRGLLDRLVPRDEPWEHNERNGDTNAHAHLRAALIGPSEVVPVVGNELGLGTWQQLVLLDFDDRPRDRVVAVTVVA